MLVRTFAKLNLRRKPIVGNVLSHYSTKIGLVSNRAFATEIVDSCLDYRLCHSKHYKIDFHSFPLRLAINRHSLKSQSSVVNRRAMSWCQLDLKTSRSNMLKKDVTTIIFISVPVYLVLCFYREKWCFLCQRTLLLDFSSMLFAAT